MFIEVVHANGLYDPASATHTNPMARHGLIELVHLAIDAAVKEQGAEVLYEPNHGWDVEEIATDPQTSELAIVSDPFLSGLSATTRDSIIVCPDGAGRLSNRRFAMHALEDERACRNKHTIVLGAFTSICVLAAAEGIKRRVPDAIVGIDAGLSLNAGGAQWQPDEHIIRDNLAAYLSPVVGARIGDSIIY